jgi:hypothetical protein
MDNALRDSLFGGGSSIGGGVRTMQLMNLLTQPGTQTMIALIFLCPRFLSSLLFVSAHRMV